MKRITIRNLKSQKAAKPRVFDAIVDGNEIYFDVKVGNKGNEVIALSDIMDQIASAESEEVLRPPKDSAQEPNSA
ncbi:MAG: hypothetical protein VB115_01330 [Christensenellaceae bacterium]|nr:hypothetical protein [Christensenellaceae bacterium]